MVRDIDTKGWCAPVAVRSYGVGAGPLALGFQVTDRVYVLPSREAIASLVSSDILIGLEAVFAMGSHNREKGTAFSGSLYGGAEQL